MGKAKSLKKLFTGKDLDVDDLVAQQKAKLKKMRANAKKEEPKDSGDISCLLYTSPSPRDS